MTRRVFLWGLDGAIEEGFIASRSSFGMTGDICGDVRNLEIGDIADMGRSSAAHLRGDPKSAARSQRYKPKTQAGVPVPRAVGLRSLKPGLVGFFVFVDQHDQGLVGLKGDEDMSLMAGMVIRQNAT